MKQSRTLALAFSLLMLVVTLIYSNHFDNGFHFDDSHTIVNNSYIKDIKNIPLYFKDGQTFSSLPSNQSYRPIVTTTLAIDYWLGGGFEDKNQDGKLDTFWFHASTFFWFLVQGLLMFFLFVKIMDKARPHPWNVWIAFFSVALYLLHAVNAETINYVISRSDSLSTLCIVAAMLIYVSNGWGKRYFLYLVLLAIGILIKPTSVMFLGLLFFYILFFETDIMERIFNKPVPIKNPKQTKSTPHSFSIGHYTQPIVHLAVTTLFAGIGYWFMDKMTPSTWVPGGSDPFKYIITQPFVMLHYFLMFVWPNQLSADTDWEVLPTIFHYRFFVGLLFILGMLVIVFITMRNKVYRPIAYGILWFFIALVPTSVIPLAEVMNDHRMFYPFVGLVLSAGWSLGLLVVRYEKEVRRSTQNLYGLVAAICLLLGIYGYQTWQRNEVWDNGISLWKDVTEKSPKNGRGWMNYGLALMEKGQYELALPAYETALKYTPNYSYLHINMGVLYNALGRQKEAEYHYQYAYGVAPDQVEVNYFYGIWLSKQNRYNEAQFHLKRVLELAPAHLNARYSLMDLFARNNDTKQLKAIAESTLQIVPEDAKAKYYLGIVPSLGQSLQNQKTALIQSGSANDLIELSYLYYKEGNFAEMIKACEQAITLDPNSATAYNNLCTAYNELKQWDKAIAACEKAIQIKPDFQLAKNNLAWAKGQKK
ncbi:MAG: tetratricopeptide repeat protein [Chitinophagales bacterium]|nr:tetratricopeptide repeat protein [Chitinophagales bacterium]